MANNATNYWKWTGALSTAWASNSNWTDGDGGAVDDYPGQLNNNAIVTLTTSATRAMTACGVAVTVVSITQGAAYAGACCVANITAGTVTTSVAGATITGGTITTLNAGADTVVSGGTITTAYLSGSAVIQGATVTTLHWNSAGTEIYGTFGATVYAYKNLEFDGGDTTFAAVTTVYVMRREVTVTVDTDTHTYVGNIAVNCSRAYGSGGPMSLSL
jgi:hypothetical protein